MLTGLFFGSFNPIHIGHLIIASYMVEFGYAEEVWFVVSPHNPLKDKNLLINEQHRLEMVNIAIQGDSRFKTCDVELSLPQPSFTIDTLKILDKKFPEKKFAIVMGADGLDTFHLWKDYEEIIRKYSRLIYPRKQDGNCINQKVENGAVLSAPLLEISSTFIRKAIKDGKDLHYFVPENVWLYIHRHGLYC